MPDREPSRVASSLPSQFGTEGVDPDLDSEIAKMQPIVDKLLVISSEGRVPSGTKRRRRLVDAHAAVRDAQADPGDA